MSIQTTGGWLDDIGNFFTGGSNNYTPAPSGYSGINNDPFGFNSDQYFGGSNFDTTYQNPGLSDYDIAARDEYFSGGGTVGITSNNSGNFFSDLANGAGNFFNGLTTSLTGLGGLFNTGLEAYARVQGIVNQINPQEKIIQIPGRAGAFIDRGNGNILPLEQAYPQLGADIQRANQANTTQTLLIVGAIGLGLVLVLKKKK